MAAKTNHGRFVWYDLMTTDPEAGIDFYSKLIGWTTAPWEEGDQPYTMWANNERPFGGVAELSEEATAQGAPPHWLAYVWVSDVKATAARAVELGAAVLHDPTDIEGAGCFAILKDPQDVVFAIYSSDAELDKESPANLGDVSWHELATTDYAAAFEFYSELFGWEKDTDMDMGPEAGIYRLYARGDTQLGGMFTKPDDMPFAGWLYYVKVEDINTSMKKVQELGGTVAVGPVEVPDGDFIAHCLDPQGAMFALHASAK